jgi:hypothetical protein
MTTTRDRKRTSDGKYDNERSASASSLADSGIEAATSDYASDDDRPVVDNFPANITEARKVLKNSRGEPEGNVRHVWMSSRVDSAPDPFDVVGPKDGRPLVVHVGSGNPNLVVKSGNVIIEQGSTWGNTVTAQGDSQVVVIARAGVKSRVRAENNARVVYDCTSEGVNDFSVVDGDAEIEVWKPGMQSASPNINHDSPWRSDTSPEFQRLHAEQSARWDEDLSPFLAKARADARAEAKNAQFRWASK